MVGTKKNKVCSSTTAKVKTKKTTTVKTVIPPYVPNKKVIVLTGVSSGMGLEILHRLATQDCVIMIVGRDPATVKTAITNIPPNTKKADINVVFADLSVMPQVRAVANEIMSRLKDKNIGHIDVIFHNATQHTNEITHTYERHEIQWATNYLAMVLLNNLLLPFLNKSENARIVSTTTKPTTKQKLDYNQIQHSRDSRKMFEYSKLADLMYTMQFNEEYRDTKICAYCVYPGIAQKQERRKGLLGLIDKFKERKALPLSQAVETVLYLLTAPHLPAKVVLYHNYRPLMPSDFALNPFNRRRLWRATNSILGIETKTE